MLRILFVLLLMTPGIAFADDRVIGVWMNAEQNLRLDILDGFKSNRGVVLAIENGIETKLGNWETEDSTTTMRIGWRASPVTFWAPDTFEWNDRAFKKQQEISEEGVVSLRQDKAGFIDRLTGSVWLTSTEGRTALFKSTFSTDSGVVETLSKDDDLDALSAWGIASGVLKIGRNVIIEARASRNYMIGLNERDEFLVFRSSSPLSIGNRSDLATQRVEFLALLVTDAWQQVFYDEYRDYRFRPIEGPFKGRRLYVKDGNLESFSTWEYSPSTGALRIGRTEYIGGLVIGNTLALMEKDGDQTFYKRKPGGLGKSFTVADVKISEINETRGAELAATLSGQFQNESYLYSFEFNEDQRTGYVHKWRSDPFTITGHELAVDLFREAERVYEIEDIVLFDERFALKRDATASRLRSKTQREVVEDRTNMEKRLERLEEQNLILRITDIYGKRYDISLPLSSLAEVTEFQLITQ